MTAALSPALVPIPYEVAQDAICGLRLAAAASRSLGRGKDGYLSAHYESEAVLFDQRADAMQAEVSGWFGQLCKPREVVS